MAKLAFILIALAASVAVCLGQQCGKYSVAPRASRITDSDGRIVGGMEVRPHSWPHTVSFQQYYAHFCGGTLIRTGPKEESDIVITAAHCFQNGLNGEEVWIGAHNLRDIPTTAQNAKVAKAVIHPQYNPDTTNNDIAIIKLVRPIKFSPTIQPACLPAHPNDVPAPGTVATVMGWGHTREGASSTSDLLNQVSLPVVSSQACANQYRNDGIQIDSNSMLCAGIPQGGKDSCQGDSGGPFVTNNNGSVTLHGVVSFGIGCARPGLPGVYAKVANYLGWINQQIKALSVHYQG